MNSCTALYVHPALIGLRLINLQKKVYVKTDRHKEFFMSRLGLLGLLGGRKKAYTIKKHSMTN